MLLTGQSYTSDTLLLKYLNNFLTMWFNLLYKHYLRLVILKQNFQLAYNNSINSSNLCVARINLWILDTHKRVSTYYIYMIPQGPHFAYRSELVKPYLMLLFIELGTHNNSVLTASYSNWITALVHWAGGYRWQTWSKAYFISSTVQIIIEPRHIP